MKMTQRPVNNLIRNQSKIDNTNEIQSMITFDASIVRVPFLIPRWVAAQVWGRYILLRSDVDPSVRLIAHELVHVNQWRRHGWSFPFRYVWQLLINGYKGNRFEKEAWAKEKESQHERLADILIRNL